MEPSLWYSSGRAGNRGGVSVARSDVRALLTPGLCTARASRKGMVGGLVTAELSRALMALWTSERWERVR